MKNVRPTYPPSWVDRFTNWLRRLPIPVWLSIILIYLFAILLYHVAFWLDGNLSFGEIDGVLLFNAIWSVIGLAFIMSLDLSAHRAIDRFATLVPRKKKELEAIRYAMKTIPAGVTLFLALLVAVVAGLGAYFDPSFLGVSQPLPIVLYLIGFIFSYSFAPIMLYQGTRQLFLVIKAYRLVDEINLFHLQPLYAFSGLSMTSSLFWVVILNMNFVSNYSANSYSTGEIVLSLALTIPYVLLAFATFIIPLWGIHRRIQITKEAAIEENGMQIEKAHHTLYALLNAGNYRKTADLEKSLASLYKMREQIEKVQTWPWNPGTLRSFLSAVFLPLGIWLTQQILSRFL